MRGALRAVYVVRYFGSRSARGAVFRDNAFVNVSCPGFRGKVLMLQISTCVFFLQILLLRLGHKDAIQFL